MPQELPEAATETTKAHVGVVRHPSTFTPLLGAATGLLENETVYLLSDRKEEEKMAKAGEVTVRVLDLEEMTDLFGRIKKALEIAKALAAPCDSPSDYSEESGVCATCDNRELCEVLEDLNQRTKSKEEGKKEKKAGMCYADEDNLVVCVFHDDKTDCLMESNGQVIRHKETCCYYDIES